MAKTTETKNLNVEFVKDFSSFLSFMPTPDEIMRRTGDAVTLYDEMLTDGRVSSLFYTRRNATMNLPIEIPETGVAKIDNYVKNALKEKNIRKWAWLLLTGALKYGYHPFEIIWKKEKGYWDISYLKGHNINQYYFDNKGSLYYSDMEGPKLLNQPFKWIIHRQEGDSHNKPQGESILKSAYWAYKFKQLGFQFWVTAAEKFSVPSVLAIFEQSGNPEAVQQRAEQLADSISSISSGSTGALGNIKDVKTLDMSGSLKDFETLISTCDVQIAYALTGQSLATNNPTTGTQALGTVHKATMRGTVENDARAISYTLQELTKMAIDLNFGKDSPYPEIIFDTGDKASWSQIIDAIKAQIPVSKTKLYSRYRLPEPKDKDDIFVITDFNSKVEDGTSNKEPSGIKNSNKEDFSDSDIGKKKLKKIIVLR